MQTSQHRHLLAAVVPRESQHSLWVLGFEPVEQSVLVEGSSGGTVAVVPLDVGDGVGALDHLDKSHLVPGGQTAIRDHPEHPEC